MCFEESAICVESYSTAQKHRYEKAMTNSSLNIHMKSSEVVTTLQDKLTEILQQAEKQPLFALGLLAVEYE